MSQTNNNIGEAFIITLPYLHGNSLTRSNDLLYVHFYCAPVFQIHWAVSGESPQNMASCHAPNKWRTVVPSASYTSPYTWYFLLLQ